MYVYTHTHKLYVYMYAEISHLKRRVNVNLMHMSIVQFKEVHL